MATAQDPIRVVRTATFEIAAPPAEVFPLFGPDRERDWASAWKPEAVDPPRVIAEEGAIFKTNHDGDEAVWVVSRFDYEQQRAEYVNFRHNDRLGQISIQVSTSDKGSYVEVTYMFTALSEKGERHIAHFTEDYYSRMMAHWEQAISHFLKTGETLQE
jgi:hypothetical protein